MGNVARHLDEGLASVNAGLESNLSNPELENYIARAKSGTLPLPRPLKDWEPNKLNDRHITMLFMRAAGMSQSRIAEIIGYDQARVSVILSHPYAQFLLNKMLAYAANAVVDMETRIKAMGPEMLDIAADIARDEDAKDSVRSSNAFKILEMGGYGAKQESTVRHEVSLPAEKSDLLSRAISEAREIVDAQWAYVEEENAGSDEAESSTETADSANVGSPPLNSSQHLLPKGVENE